MPGYPSRCVRYRTVARRRACYTALYQLYRVQMCFEIALQCKEIGGKIVRRPVIGGIRVKPVKVRIA
jgi:hypothetical protein